MNEAIDHVRKGSIRPLSLVILAGAVVLVAAACGGSRESGTSSSQTGTPSGQAAAPADSASMVERGGYLVTLGGCNDCHTPWKMGAHGAEPDMALMLSGHPEAMKMPKAPDPGDSPWGWYGALTNTAFSGPWGVSYAYNLTPDDTGLGVLSEEMFIQAMRSGKHLGVGRPIMPPMPWPSYAKATDDDLRAMYAYLKSIPPIRNVVPEYEPPAGAMAH